MQLRHVIRRPAPPPHRAAARAASVAGQRQVTGAIRRPCLGRAAAPPELVVQPLGPASASLRNRPGCDRRHLTPPGGTRSCGAGARHRGSAGTRTVIAANAAPNRGTTEPGTELVGDPARRTPPADRLHPVQRFGDIGEQHLGSLSPSSTTPTQPPGRSARPTAQQHRFPIARRGNDRHDRTQLIPRQPIDQRPPGHRPARPPDDAASIRQDQTPAHPRGAHAPRCDSWPDPPERCAPMLFRGIEQVSRQPSGRLIQVERRGTDRRPRCASVWQRTPRDPLSTDPSAQTRSPAGLDAQRRARRRAARRHLMDLVDPAGRR